jgi:hypothetical protein
VVMMMMMMMMHQTDFGSKWSASGVCLADQNFPVYIEIGFFVTFFLTS